MAGGVGGNSGGNWAPLRGGEAETPRAPQTCEGAENGRGLGGRGGGSL